MIRAEEPGQVREALEAIEGAIANGLCAAGFLTYEAARAFDSALVTRPQGTLPLLWFGLYERSESVELPQTGSEPGSPAPPREWRPTVDPADYRASVARIHERIAQGDTYQVNFTWRLETDFESDPWPFFLARANRHHTGYAAFVDTGDHAICSFSPELFFRLDGSKLVCRPMKGTARRGLYPADDDRRREELRGSAKNRAENVMIVDMVRNDLGRIARPGSVATPQLFEIETYPTVLQMTSTVEADTESSLTEILTALFPSASITGAPKIETMKTIAELENRPRGIYTGAIGWAGPERQALFNVAIRTAVIDRATQSAEYGTGGGIVWDSEPEAEHAEGLTKTLVLDAEPPPFSLLETMRWQSGTYHLLDRHLGRLADSAAFLGFEFDEVRVRAQLRELSERLARSTASSPRRVRLLLARDGSIEMEHHEISEPKPSWALELAREPIDSEDRSYFHKTTERSAYDAFRRAAPAADDVLLWNGAGQLTETTLANIALRLGGSWYTPPVACGLLAGTQRAEFLAEGRLIERVLTLEDLEQADALAVVNSVRGWVPADLMRVY